MRLCKCIFVSGMIVLVAMQKNLLEALSGIVLPEVDEPESDEIQLKAFTAAHKDEFRFITLLDLYQEQPTLLDCCLNDIVLKLLPYIHFLDEGQTKLDQLSSCTFKLLSHLAKVRGYKSFCVYLPHEVSYLEKVLSSLERLSDDFHAHYVLLLWLVIICKNPFSLNRFAPNAKDPLHTAQRIISVALSYLSKAVDRCHPVAALLLAITVCRAETCAVLLPSLVKNSVENLQNCGEKSSVNAKLIGNLYLLVAIFKQGQRKDLLPLTPLVLQSLDFMLYMNNVDFIVKKLVTKLVQRVGMVFLKPKVALWRYNRGNRILTFDNRETGSNINGNRGDEEDLGEDDCYNIPEKELEAILDIILMSLRDCDTGVRWSAAKGVGRIASRLPKILAEEVVRSIIGNNFNDVFAHAAWHGGCLAIAELARRGYLPADLLPEVVKILEKALVYEEPRGRYALGANVRDAACYIAWALARAFRVSDLALYLLDIATALVCVALFDREINVRRAASAAFQENVGRQGSIPNGIEILTKIDFYAVGQRNRTYVEIACEIAEYSNYTLPIIEHLLFKKVCHWDEKLRFLAAESLRRLAKKHGSLIYKQVPQYVLPLLDHKFPAQRQGGILALGEILSGLHESGFELSSEILKKAAEVPPQYYSLCEKKSRITGGFLIRRAINTFIQLLSPVIPLSLIPVDDWLKAVELNISDTNEEMRRAAGYAAVAYFDLFKQPEDVKKLASRVTEQYLSEFLRADSETHRQGIALLLSCLHTPVLLEICNGVYVYEQIIITLTSVIKKRNSLDSLWAFGRQEALKAITEIALKVGINNLGNLEQFTYCILNAMDDYTISRKGDIGRFLRESSMQSLSLIVPKINDKCLQMKIIDKSICKIVQQSCEKIDSVRVDFWTTLNVLLMLINVT
uniref:Tubulin-specific chaperone D n=1 Tax=Syphacia muris TaxID=451379 RepID=A0A0N5B161_9BILA